MLINLGHMTIITYGDCLILQSYTEHVITKVIDQTPRLVPKQLYRSWTANIEATDTKVYEAVRVVRQIANGCRRTLC